MSIERPIEYGFDGTGNWLFGGAVGGVVGSLLFGGVLWLVDPTIITEVIPALYGIDPIGTAGWVFHLVHGLVLGLVFGVLLSRDPILGTVMADVETGFIASMGPGLRFTLAGVVYGLAVWAILPLLVLPTWVAIGGIDDPGFPMLAFESLVGHLLYGLLLGALFSVVVEISQEAKAADAPFEEATDSTRE
ncbi:hypothetical protein [Natronobacterium gregoryi]|uniref:Histidine kinase n=2 Tax=Natronobacterium gregoryi TaxID=44930 RepID=L0AJ68_NATGS|nr:hypothetical protein [Natronobacterium gregoryi]AFZ73851.1 hypothetical protein Natgr_2702 [Natronobacterium gregoryi SP2]ELY65097.1 hypothetical protein C490_14045 [Natronobacterium gregoryi SP2]PLK19694.1 hypothetical protein CYV19_13345 [Natronobacterium gregoryi SP2]SFJ42529.1 hypothetical protein SAMN05443661_12840 [Natronobacterium gregoryi]